MLPAGTPSWLPATLSTSAILCSTEQNLPSDPAKDWFRIERPSYRKASTPEYARMRDDFELELLGEFQICEALPEIPLRRIVPAEQAHFCKRRFFIE
jgi:hypothetical protein